MTNETHIITELRETINRAENMAPFMRSDMIGLLESAKYEIETLTDNLKQMKEQRDEARRMACEFWVMDGSGYSSSFRAKEDALARGWDCFKEETP